MTDSSRKRKATNYGSGSSSGSSLKPDELAGKICSLQHPIALKAMLLEIATAVPDALKVMVSVANRDVKLRTVIVDGLGPSITVAKLSHVYSACGAINSCTMQSSGDTVGCTIEFESVEGALAAVQSPTRFVYGAEVSQRLADATDANYTLGSTESRIATPAAVDIAHGGSNGSTSGGINNSGGPNAVRNEQYKLFIKGLSYGTTTAMLRQAFEPLGVIESCEAVLDKQNGRCKGYGFVTYKSVQDAIHAQSHAPAVLDGRTISTFFSQSKEEHAQFVASRGTAPTASPHAPSHGYPPPMPGYPISAGVVNADTVPPIQGQTQHYPMHQYPPPPASYPTPLSAGSHGYYGVSSYPQESYPTHTTGSYSQHPQQPPPPMDSAYSHGRNHGYQHDYKRRR